MPIGGIPTYWNKILREQILLEEKKSIFGMTLSI
jgi:hypothetical protein